jgi:hypothetical protein
MKTLFLNIGVLLIYESEARREFLLTLQQAIANKLIGAHTLNQ